MSVAVLDIPRVYTGIAEWLACIIFASQMGFRLSRKWRIPIAVGALAIQCVFLVITDDWPIFLWIPCMIVAAGLMTALLFIMYNLDFYAAMYTCVRAFIVAEFAASLEWQIHCYLWPADDSPWWKCYGLLILVYGGVFSAMVLLEDRCDPQRKRLSVTAHEMLIALLMGVSVFAISNLSFYLETPFSGHYAGEILNVRTITDLFGVAMLYAYHLLRGQSQAQKELDAMQVMLENQYAQYRMSRDSIEMVNRKYHDLKHQIAALRAEPDAAVRNRWLDEMEQDISAYEAQNKTGNSVLDVLLTGKSLYCQKHSIGFTVVADGKHLHVMDMMDICTLFGNALDNAIECELKLPDKSKRMIHLTLTTQRQFLLLQVENYCPEAPSFRNGLPVTTKRDVQNHGIGLKSIRHTARKYGGSATVQMKDGWFVLKVLIPMSQGEGDGADGCS